MTDLTEIGIKEGSIFLTKHNQVPDFIIHKNARLKGKTLNARFI